MHIELTTGKDSFRAKMGASRRNCGVKTYAMTNHADKSGRKVPRVHPLFVIYKDKMPNFGTTSLVQTIPATDKFGATDAGQWFVNRHEVMPFTEVLIEYTTRESTGFSERVEYMLIVPREDAPLYRVRLELPPHPLSSVPTVFFEGRFHIVDSDSDLDPATLKAWRQHFGIHTEQDLQVSDLLDVNQDFQVFSPMVLEQKPRNATKAIIKEVAGKQTVKIRRTRRIKTR